jgi:hypothetical protein
MSSLWSQSQVAAKTTHPQPVRSRVLADLVSHLTPLNTPVHVAADRDTTTTILACRQPLLRTCRDSSSATRNEGPCLGMPVQQWHLCHGLVPLEVLFYIPQPSWRKCWPTDLRRYPRGLALAASFPHHPEPNGIRQHVEIVIGVEQFEVMHQAVGADDHADRLARCNSAAA